MNIKDRILNLNRQHSGENTDIEDLLLTLITKYQLFEPCRYLSEDEEWLNVSMVSLESDDASQPMSILKSELTAFGVFNREDVDVNSNQKESQGLYQ